MPHDVESASTTDGLPVSISLGPTLEREHIPAQASLVDGRVMLLCLLSITIAAAAALVAEVLVHAINLFTNISFHGSLSLEYVAPSVAHRGAWVILLPVVGGIIVGFMARYGSRAIRGHGIPEAMEQVLLNQSRIPARMTFLKPLSAAVAIGTGGPFGAEGPIIATGGAMGSVVGQLLSTTAAERKTLLAAGAAAGMAATFGSPVSAVLLAIELLLFEFRPRSIIPVALAAVTAAAIRAGFHGGDPVFAMTNLAEPSGAAMTAYVLLGAVIGVASVLVTRIVYGIEDLFEKLPVHWMWWPAIGGVAVGIVGSFMPRTFGVGYFNITDMLSARLTLGLVAGLAALKFISWSISLGSGTSGGTLAPLFTIGGALGTVLTIFASRLLPEAGIDPRIGALVGMAAMFAGASRALLASVVFAFETTLQPLGLLPLLGGCSASFMVSCLLMRHSIMTEKIARRGVRVPGEYVADFLDHVSVGKRCSKKIVTLPADQPLAETRRWIASHAAGSTHQGFPIVDETGVPLGVLTRRDLLDPSISESQRLRAMIRRAPVLVSEDASLRQAADQMVRHDIGRLLVVSANGKATLSGIVTRSDLLKAHRVRLEQTTRKERRVSL